ncbi:MAG: hypothetical protein ACRD63_01460 [Pyrinomonadaceae bacterium]
MQNTHELYRETIAHLPSEERLQLAALILNDLAVVKPDEKNLSIVELIQSFLPRRGFKTSSEADEYLRKERDSWDH